MTVHTPRDCILSCHTRMHEHMFHQVPYIDGPHLKQSPSGSVRVLAASAGHGKAVHLFLVHKDAVHGQLVRLVCSGVHIYMHTHAHAVPDQEGGKHNPEVLSQPCTFTKIHSASWLRFCTCMCTSRHDASLLWLASLEDCVSGPTLFAMADATGS